jgi:hypothetical protein
MKKSAFVFVLIIILLTIGLNTPCIAEKKVSFSFSQNLGISILPGHFEDFGLRWSYKDAITSGVNLNIEFQDSSLGISFSKSTHDLDEINGLLAEGKLEISSLSIDGKLFSKKNQSRPYIIGGFAYHFCECAILGHQDDYGLDFGGGVEYMVNDTFLLGGEAKYRVIFSDFYIGGIFTYVLNLRYRF